MLYYENIPGIVIDTVSALYRESYVDIQANTAARLWSAIDTSSQLADIKLVASQGALVLCVVLTGFIVFVVLQKRALKAQSAPDEPEPADAQSLAPVPTGVLRDRWNVILAHLDTPHEAQWKLAVMEADKLVDDSLARAGYAGATFGDRLSNIQPGTLVSLDGVWWAHKIRNRLAHEIDYFLRYTEARQAIGYYEAALSELQLI